MIEQVGIYFDGLASNLNSQYLVSSAQKHRTTNGSNREVFVESFLNQHLPERLRAFQCGQIYGLDQPASKQIDVVVAHDAGVRFDFLASPLTLAEHVVAAISVKSFLDKAGLADALSGLASIPRASEKILGFGLMESLFAKNKFHTVYPRMFVFAFEGSSFDTMLVHLKEYLEVNGSDNLTPLAVVVNQKYFILVKRDLQGELEVRSMEIKPSHSPGWPLFWMIMDISQSVGWLNSMRLDYEPYYKQMFR